MECIDCRSRHIVKNGHGRNDSQRLWCKDCNMTFTVGGVRGTYSVAFIQQVVDAYCHTENSARQVISDFGVSSKTLIAWKKEHVAVCKDCKKKKILV